MISPVRLNKPECPKEVQSSLDINLSTILGISSRDDTRSGQVHKDSLSICKCERLANVTPNYKSSQKDLVNYSSVSLTSVPTKVMEQSISSATTQNMKENLTSMGIRLTHYRFMKGTVCWLTWCPSTTKWPNLLNNRNTVDGVPLGFCNQRHLPSILLRKLAAHSLDKCTCSLNEKLVGWLG